MTTKPTRAPDLALRKQRGEKIVVLTAYDATLTRLFESAGVDVLLVGDSLGMTILGFDTTIPVTMDAMLHHTAAVSRAAHSALVVADLPFFSYHVSTEQALTNAARLIQEGGAAAVKLEGGSPIVETVRRIVDAGIPVMGHLGLLPQSVHRFGGFKRQAQTEDGARQLLADAQALEQAGVFSLVLESIPHDLAHDVSRALRIPTIGIGAGPHCDGQVLVCYDVLGFNDAPPPFAKRYAPLGTAIVHAVEAYATEIRSGTYTGKADA